MCKIKPNISEVMGLLAILWPIVCGTFEGDLESITLIVGNMNELIEQSITMLGQAFINVSYHRRIQTLSFLLNDTQTKSIFKEETSLLSQTQK